MALTMAIMTIREIITCNCIELTENIEHLKTALCLAFNQSNQVQGLCCVNRELKQNKDNLKTAFCFAFNQSNQVQGCVLVPEGAFPPSFVMASMLD